MSPDVNPLDYTQLFRTTSTIQQCALFRKQKQNEFDLEELAMESTVLFFYECAGNGECGIRLTSTSMILSSQQDLFGLPSRSSLHSLKPPRHVSTREC